MWEEYELTLYPLPGHTEYAVAIGFTVDGKKVLCTGDQYADEDGLFCNYVYKNRFSYDDYEKSAALYRSLSPDLILTGHWQYRERGADYWDQLEEKGRELAALHEKLLPESGVRFDIDQRLVSCHPYQIFGKQGDEKKLTVSVTNPYPKAVQAGISLVLPKGVAIKEISKDVAVAGNKELSKGAAVAGDKEFCAEIEAGETKEIPVTLQIAGGKARRLRLGIDLVLDGIKMGQAAEALITCG